MSKSIISDFEVDEWQRNDYRLAVPADTPNGYFFAIEDANTFSFYGTDTLDHKQHGETQHGGDGSLVLLPEHKRTVPPCSEVIV